MSVLAEKCDVLMEITRSQHRDELFADLICRTRPLGICVMEGCDHTQPMFTNQQWTHCDSCLCATMYNGLNLLKSLGNSGTNPCGEIEL